MINNIDEKNTANIQYALGHAMDAAAELGVPGDVIIREVVRLALSLLGAQHGGAANLPLVLETMAAEIRENPPRPN